MLGKFFAILGYFYSNDLVPLLNLSPMSGRRCC